MVTNWCVHLISENIISENSIRKAKISCMQMAFIKNYIKKNLQQCSLSVVLLI